MWDSGSEEIFTSLVFAVATGEVFCGTSSVVPSPDFDSAVSFGEVVTADALFGFEEAAACGVRSFRTRLLNPSA